MKYLFGRPTPRGNIPEVEKHNRIFPCDILLSKFMHSHYAFLNIRKIFLANDYDYLILASDDLIVKPESFYTIRDVLDGVQFPVLSGYCNVDEKDYPKGDVNISFSLPPKYRPRVDKYSWLKKEEVPPTIFKVMFAGFAFTAIRRDVVEGASLENDRKFYPEWKESLGCCHDVVFSHFCAETDVPILVHGGVFLKHLRASGSERVIKEKPQLIHITKNKTFNLNPVTTP